MKVMNVMVLPKHGGSPYDFQLDEEQTNSLFQDIKSWARTGSPGGNVYTTSEGGRRGICFDNVDRIQADAAEVMPQTDANPFAEELTPELATAFVEYTRLRLQLARMLDQNPMLKWLVISMEQPPEMGISDNLTPPAYWQP